MNLDNGTGVDCWQHYHVEVRRSKNCPVMNSERGGGGGGRGGGGKLSWSLSGTRPVAGWETKG